MCGVWVDGILFLFFLEQFKSLFKVPFHHSTRPAGLEEEEIDPGWSQLSPAQNEGASGWQEMKSVKQRFKTGTQQNKKKEKKVLRQPVYERPQPPRSSRFTQQVELWQERRTLAQTGVGLSVSDSCLHVKRDNMEFGWISVFWRKTKVFVWGEHSWGTLYKHSWPLPKECKHATWDAKKVGKNCLKPITYPKILSKAVCTQCLCFRLCAVLQSLSTLCQMESCRIMHRPF